MIKISVVMACRNSKRKFLHASIKSILNQSLSDFELIIIDDGSDIPIESLIDEFNDPRITYYRISHSGLGAALNYGILKSKGKYIARIDDDDFMCENRLEKQWNYLEKFHDVVCVGTQIFFKTSNKFKAIRKFPTDHKTIVNDLISLKFSLAHCSVMFRRDAYNEIGGYRIYGGGQDLDLFLQLSTKGFLANLDEYLTCYNLSNSGLSLNNPSKKYNAYLFAIKEFNSLESSIEYKSQILNTLKTLTIDGQNEKKWVFSLKRFLLIYYVLIFGSNITKRL